MVEFFVEFFEEQLAEFTRPPVQAEVVIDATVAVLPSPSKSETDAIDQVMREIGPTPSESPLASIMKEKILHRNKVRLANYEAWKQSFLTVLAELNAIAEFFNSTADYAQSGYGMTLREYDLLALEKYEDIINGRKATRTWFAGLEIVGPDSRERVLFFFNRASRSIMQDEKASRVSLAISRFDGNQYNRLSSEPITLREIGYRDGELLFFSRDEVLSFSSVRYALESFLKEIIASYL